MSLKYQQWLEEEKLWAHEIDQRVSNMMKKNWILMPIISIILLDVLGFALGGLGQLPKYSLYGLIFGLFLDIILLPLILLGRPGKRYFKMLKKEIAKELPNESEREVFASQMLTKDGDEKISCIDWISSDKRDEKIMIAKDYAVEFYRGRVILVKLRQVEKIELDVSDNTTVIHGDSANVRIHTVTFPIYFYYYNNQNVSKLFKIQFSDKTFYFPSRNIRDQVVEELSLRSSN